MSSLLINPIRGCEPLEVDCPICAWWWSRHHRLPRWLDSRLMTRSWNRHLKTKRHRAAFNRMADRLVRNTRQENP